MIKILSGSTKAFAKTARTIVANGGDLYEWIFGGAPAGWVTFTTEHTLSGEFAEGSVQLVRVKGGGQPVRRASVDLRNHFPVCPLPG